MKLIPILIASTITIGLFARSASATCNPCIKGSGCEPPCIDMGTCACSVTSGTNLFPACNTGPQGTYEFDNGAGPNSSSDWDLTASIPGFSLAPSGGCGGYAICEKTFNGSGDTWQYPYVTANGHVHWEVGSEGSGGEMSAAINAWPIIGSGYSGEPFGCGTTCAIQAEYTSVTATPGQGLQTATIPGVTPGTSFNCIFAREGDLGPGSRQGSIQVLFQGSTLTAAAYNPSGGDSAFSFMEVQTLFRQHGPLPISPVKVGTTSSVLLASNCLAAGLVEVETNNESIFWSGQAASLGAIFSGQSTEGLCLLPQ